jgi:hypothetical protein
MTRRENLADPNSCFNKAADDELIFVLREKDPDAPGTIRDWVKRRLARGKNKASDAKIVEALNLAHKMEKRQKRAKA